MEKWVVKVTKYYHYETVQIGGQDDDVCKNMSKGLDITRATNYNARGSITTSNTLRPHIKAQKGQNTSISG